MLARTLEQLLTSGDVVDRITIEIEDGRRFVWRIFSEGRELDAISGMPANVASMIRTTQTLVNVGLGIDDDAGSDPSLN